MEQIRQEIYKQWDYQTNNQQIAYVNMNNLYLAIERGDVELDRRTGNALYNLLNIAYPEKYDNGIVSMRNYWMKEFEKLDGWNEW